MTSSRIFLPPALLVVGIVGALGTLGTGCSRRSETVKGPSGPPPTAQQRVEQIQSDPVASEDVKNVRLHNARENSGPPIRR